MGIEYQSEPRTARVLGSGCLTRMFAPKPPKSLRIQPFKSGSRVPFLNVSKMYGNQNPEFVKQAQTARASRPTTVPTSSPLTERRKFGSFHSDSVPRGWLPDQQSQPSSGRFQRHLHPPPEQEGTCQPSAPTEPRTAPASCFLTGRQRGVRWTDSRTPAIGYQGHIHGKQFTMGRTFNNMLQEGDVKGSEAKDGMPELLQPTVTTPGNAYYGNFADGEVFRGCTRNRSAVHVGDDRDTAFQTTTESEFQPPQGKQEKVRRLMRSG